MITAYLIKVDAMARDEAIKLLKSKRPIVNPNDSFRDQLKEYEK